MATGVHDEATVMHLAILQTDFHPGGNPIGVLTVVFYSSMFEVYFLHDGAGLGVI
jgi:hypothetical protein